MKEINYKDMTFNPFNLIGDECRQHRLFRGSQAGTGPYGDGTVARGFRGKWLTGRIPGSCKAWRLSDSYYLQNS